MGNYSMTDLRPALACAPVGCPGLIGLPVAHASGVPGLAGSTSFRVALPVARTVGVLPRPESASSYHGRPAIHGRLGPHPRCTRRARGVHRLRGDQEPSAGEAQGATPSGAGPIANQVVGAHLAAISGGSRASALPRTSCRRDDSPEPAADAGGMSRADMDGRRPDVGAGRGDIRLGIPAAVAGRPRTSFRASPLQQEAACSVGNRNLLMRAPRAYARTPPGYDNAGQMPGVMRISAARRISRARPGNGARPLPS